MICPVCASENIFYSKKRGRYFCEDCDAGFDTPSNATGMRIFISYGHDKNAAIVSKIKDYLSDKGYDAWIDTSQIPQGSDWRERITNGIIGSNGILSFLSKHSVRDPGVCIDELRIALRLKHAYLKTVLLEQESEVKPPKSVQNIQWIDLSNWDTVDPEQWEDYFQRKMQEVLAVLNSDEARTYNAEIELLTKRLGVFDNTTKETHLLKQVFIGREWLAKEVHSWVENPRQQTMMLYGVPGSGKSAFTANLSQYTPSVIGTIFFEWNNHTLTDCDYVIRLFALKLAARLPDYRKMLCAQLAQEEDSKLLLNRHHGSGLFDLLILNPLQCCIDGNRDISVFVFDGLDETSSAISDLLLRKARQLPFWLKVLFTSRQDETSHLRHSVDLSLCLDDSSVYHENDIAEYLLFRLRCSKAQCAAMAKKCEGSFMYAKTLCDAVLNGTMALADTEALPAGIDLFYFDYFNRLFPESRSYSKARVFLELLCTEDELPEELIRKCLNADKYELWEIRSSLRSLIRTTTTTGFHRHKTYKFVHKSIRDWLTSPALSGKYHIDPSNGYRTLINLTDCDGSGDSLNFEKVDITRFYYRNHPKWMIRAGYCDRYRDMLLSSFDPAEIDALMRRRDFEQPSLQYTYYYKFLPWEWADQLPSDYPMTELLRTAREIVLYPRKYMVSNFSHRSFQISLLILSSCMDSGRFAPVFFELMQLYKFDGYFRSAVSDDLGETRDGWDKYYMTRDAVICLKKCDARGIPVPPPVRLTCEKMKLSYHYYWGSEPKWNCVKELFTEPELAKDVCVLPKETDESWAVQGCGKYNTRSLTYFLTDSDEEDWSFVRRCADNYADVNAACSQALQAQQSKRTDSRTSRRIAFIQAIQQGL